MVARRDVELVIRARDQASNALQRISNAFDQFDTRQERSQAQGRETGTVFQQLGTSLAQLQQNLGGVGAISQLQGQLDSAASAIGRIQAEIRESTSTTGQYRADIQRVEAELKKLEATEARRVATLRNSQAAIKDANASSRERRGLLQAAATEQTRLRAEIRATTAALKEERRVERGIVDRLNRAETGRPVGRQGLPSNEDIARNREALQRLTQQEAELRNQQLEVAESTRVIREEFNKANRDIRTHTNRITKAKAAQEESAASISVTRKELARLNTEQAKAVRSQRRLTGQLDEAEQGQKALAATYQQTEQAIRELEGRLRGPFLRAFGEQRERALQAQRAYREYGAEAGRLGRQLRGVENPSRSLVDAFNRNREASARFRQEYRQQLGVLAQARSILRESGGDTDALAARQQRLTDILARGASSYERTAQASERAQKASRTLAEAQARAATGMDRTGRAAQRMTRQMRRGTAESRAFAAALRQATGGTRQSLSFFQRLRGELLSLIAAYGGLFAAVRGVNAVLQSSIAVQGVENRLSAALGGDPEKVANELDFLRRTANRLGISFGVLAQEYSKFAIAAQGTELQGQATRDIFLAVAEAARVQQLSVDQVQGVFLALTQIVSKGAVAMEELRRQLGDRIPGAVPIFAQGVGVATGELIKLVETGDLSANTLILFAEELQERFGPQLEQSLDKTAAAQGRFFDQLFRATLEIGSAGGLQGLTDFFERLSNLLGSAEFLSFAQRLGAGLQTLLSIVATLAENFRILFAILAALVFFRLARVLQVLILRFTGVNRGLLRAIVRTRQLRRAMLGLSRSTGGAAVAFRSLRVAVISFLGSTGFGIAFALIGTAIASWVTRTDEATEALVDHRNIVDEVKDAYDRAGGSAEKWAENLQDLTVTDARANLEDLRSELRGLEGAFQDLLNEELGLGPNFFERLVGRETPILIRTVVEDFRRLFEAYRSGALSAQDFATEVDKVIEANRKLLPSLVEPASQLLELAADMAETSTRASEMEDVFLALQGVLRGDYDQAQAALDRLSGAVDGLGDSVDGNIERIKLYNDAFARLRGELPKLLRQLDQAENNAPFQGGPGLIRANVFEDFQETLGAVRALAEAAGVGTEELDRLEAQFRSLAEAARVFGATRSGNEAAIRLLTESTGLPFEDLIGDVEAARQRLDAAIGRDLFSAFSARAQAVIIEVVRSLQGVTPELEAALRDALQRGTLDPLRDFIETSGPLGGARAGALLGDSVDLGVSTNAFVRERQRIRRRVAELRAEVAEQSRLNRHLRREATIEAEIAEQRRRNPGISAEEVETLRQLTGLLFDQEEAEKRIARLQGQRQQINDEIALQSQVGNEALVSALEDQARRLRTEMRAALEEALAVAQAINNPDLVVQTEISNLRAQLAQLRLDEGESIQRQVDGLQELIGALESQRESRLDLGQPVEELNEQLQEARMHLQAAAQESLAFLQSLGSQDPTIQARIVQLQQLITELRNTGTVFGLTFDQIRDALRSNLSSAIDSFTKSIQDGEASVRGLWDTFRQFASDFLRQIANMILQQLAFNLVAGIIGGAVGGSFGGASAGSLPAGGFAQDAVSGAGAAGAGRFAADAAVPSIQALRIPAVVAATEQALGDRSFATGGTGEGGRGVRIVNTFDAVSFLEEALRSRDGERVLVNEVSRRRSEFRGALGIT